MSPAYFGVQFLPLAYKRKAFKPYIKTLLCYLRDMSCQLHKLCAGLSPKNRILFIYIQTRAENKTNIFFLSKGRAMFQDMWYM